MVRCASAKGDPAPPDLSPLGTAIDPFNHPTDGPKWRRRVSSVVSDALDSGIAGFLLAVLRKGEVADPPPRLSIAGRDGDGRNQPPRRRSETAEDSILRRFGHLVRRDLRISRCCGAKRRGGILPGCPSPVGRAMDDFGHPTRDPKRRKRVSSVVLDALGSGIAGFLRAVLRKGEVADPPPRVSIAGREGNGRLQPPHRRSKTAEESLLRRFGHLVLGDLRIPRCCGAKKRGGTRLPGCPSPVGRAMDGFGHPTRSPKRRRRVSSVVFDALHSGIGESLRAGLRKGGRALASRGVYRRSGRRWTRPTSQKAVQNRGEVSFPRLCTAFARRSFPPTAP